MRRAESLCGQSQTTSENATRASANRRSASEAQKFAAGRKTEPMNRPVNRSAFAKRALAARLDPSLQVVQHAPAASDRLKGRQWSSALLRRESCQIIDAARVIRATTSSGHLLCASGDLGAHGVGSRLGAPRENVAGEQAEHRE